MAQKNRTKEIWLIPKRVNLHQTICLIDGIIERKYNGTSWNPHKQNDLGVNLKKWGATKYGKNISPQAIRTLVASVPQYLGFLYINTESTPNTICLTEAGIDLWHRHKEELVKVTNLVKGKDLLITESKAVLRQMEKLQITNPVINKDCQNICIFPFRFMLKVLLRVGYLDQEEIAYFLFKVRSEDEVDIIVQEIENFRKLSTKNREALIKAFKNTQIGNITLVKASSAGYFISLCQMTGIMDKMKVAPDNRSETITALKIKDKYTEYVEEMLNSRYKNAEVYDFGDNLQLWTEYIGNPAREFPPIDVSIINKANSNFLIQVFKDGICRYDDLIEGNGVLQFPMFVDERYDVKVIDASTGDELDALNICPSYEQREYEIEGQIRNAAAENETPESVAKEIIEHCEAANFAGKTLNYLNTLSKVTGIDKAGDKALRGAYFEYYVYKMLSILKSEKVIDEVAWNGRIGKYGLPVQAPGGKIGTPDMVFVIDDLHVVLELTTIKAKALQFSAEGSSVPDHIRLYKQGVTKNVVGIFCAPVIHERNTAIMKSTMASYGIKLHCITDKELIELLLTRDRTNIKKYLITKM
ncbi:MAG: AlwI family type II restriction endonuclease [Eubacteriales bacterium]|nr:AlwI family type II restriction endonuclease [Eubacteriales bacterium]